MKHILFPTDFSDNAHNAFVYAIHLADTLEARITSVHILETNDQENNRVPEKTYERMQKEIERAFVKYQQEAKTLHEISESVLLTDVEMNHVLKEGDFVERFTEVVEKEQPDLIVMGTTGATSLRKVFWGSNTTHLLTKVECPVLIIPENYAYRTIKKVAYATEVEWFENPTIDEALDFAQSIGCTLSCFNIAKVGKQKEQALLKMEDYEYKYRRIGGVTFEVIENSDVLFGIHEYVKLN